MKYYVVWFSNNNNEIMSIECHETEEARDKAIGLYYQKSNRNWVFKLHNEVC